MNSMDPRSSDCGNAHGAGSRLEGVCTTKLYVALQLMELGLALRRQRLVREHPYETSASIDNRLDTWLASSVRPLYANTNR